MELHSSLAADSGLVVQESIMPQNPPSLTDQLASRVKTFATNMGLSQRQIARLLKLDEGHLSKFLKGAAGLSDEMTLKVLRLTSLSKKDLAPKFGSSERITSKIMSLHEKGRPMKLYGENWTPGQQGKDPNDGGSISDGDDPGTTEDFLRNQIEIHKAAITVISDYLVKAKVNRGDGTTSGPRKISDSLTVKPAQMLAHVEKERQLAEEELEIQKRINEERKKRLAAQIELADVRKEGLFSTK